MKHWLKSLTLVGLLAAQACSQTSIEPNFDAERTLEGRHLGRLNIAGTQEDSGNNLNLYKIRGGYALKANLDENETAKDKRKGDVVLSRNRDYRWFAGLQWRFEF